jgi:hypothetical protein
MFKSKVARFDGRPSVSCRDLKEQQFTVILLKSENCGLRADSALQEKVRSVYIRGQ